MRNIALFAAVAVAAALALPAFAETKIATIDLEKVVRLHPNTASDKKLLEKTLQDYTQEADALEAAAVAARKEFEAVAADMRNPALGEKAKKKAEEEARAKFEAAKQAEQAAIEKKRSLQRNLTDQEVRMLKRTLDEIEDVIAKYAKDNGVSAVLPTSGAKLGIAPAVFWTDDSLDITAEIMKIMKIEDVPEEAEADKATEAKSEEKAGKQQ